ncbi:diaminobutyrate acetyltransferase [Aquibacillus halophilus]|uniref:L-2,4-diaminobutyric acid acetyltransferase n=1 Tax=Aquibacillus halophilus TaxID=930132 RepID=A0A6A8D7M5_9BACI|nr:diaminobutyrate acetyltransferase [Aquibacillus halophilus]
MRKPLLEDGKKIWRLIKETKVLDLNSAYYYTILCKYFTDTCVVAEENGEIVGFISAFREPTEMRSIFVWQVAVDQSQRGKGLASSLLQGLLKRKECSDINYLDTTISPSNEASKALFQKLANTLKTKMVETEILHPSLFPNENHELEQTYRIGPFHQELGGGKQ